MFTGLTPLLVTGVADFTFTTPNGDDVLTIDSPAAGQNRISGTSGGVGFEALTFSSVTSLIIDADANDDGSPADSITFSSDLDATGLSLLTVESGAGSTTTFSSAITTGSGISVSSGSINVNSPIDVTGTAAVTLDALGSAGVLNINQAITTVSGAVLLTSDDDVTFAAAGDVSSTSGNVSIEADHEFCMKKCRGYHLLGLFKN